MISEQPKRQPICEQITQLGEDYSFTSRAYPGENGFYIISHYLDSIPWPLCMQSIRSKDINGRTVEELCLELHSRVFQLIYDQPLPKPI